MKVYDSFLFAGELDMLECRLYELQDSPVQHVIVEGTRTMLGAVKPRHYLEHEERFARWADRITYVSFEPGTDEPGKDVNWPVPEHLLAASREAWAREHSCRQATRLGLDGIEEGDILIHGDVDEIPSPQTISRLQQMAETGAWPALPFKIGLRWATFAVDWVSPWTWPAPSVMCVGSYLCDNFTMLREHGWQVMSFDNPGWHLTWIGGPEAIQQKLDRFTHLEQREEITAGNREGKYYEKGLLWAGGRPDGSVHPETQMIAADVDETWPRWVRERRCPESWFRPR